MEQVQHNYGPNPEPFSLKIERGQKGTYAWEIGIKGSEPSVMLEQIKAIDTQLKKEFLEAA